MAEISLRAYQQEIQDMIDHGHFDEAVAHCQNVLARFPKHIETYRLLGKAYLEQGRHAEAADVFQRVLSAIPDDFLSHVAMAIMAEDAGNLDRAIWHMERAFEVNPSNPTVQQEVRRLRGRRDGVEPSRLRMTRASLARMYLKGGLDEQAAVEVNAALGEDPDRPDLQVVQANAYLKMGKSAEAAEVCNRLLDKLPYCLEANQILGRILWKTGRKQEAQDVFRRLATLDPYVGVRPPTEDGRMPEVPAEAVLVNRLSWTPPLQEVKGPPLGWAEGLGLKKEEPEKVEIPQWLEPNKAVPVEPASPFGAEAEESPFHAPDWLGEAAAEIPDTSGIQAEKLPPEEPEAALARTGQELPDWLRGGSTTEGTPPPPLTPADWLKPTAPAKEEPTGDFAEWLKAVGGEETLARAGEGLPEWLKPEGEPAQPAAAAESLPDWLKGEAAEPGQVTEEYPEISSEAPSSQETPPSAEGGLAWLSETGTEPIVSPFDLAAANESDKGGKLPDWLEAEMKESPAFVSGGNAPEPEGGRLAPAAEELSAAGQPPAWLKAPGVEDGGLSTSAGSSELSSTGPGEAVAPALPATELPDWLQPEKAGPEKTSGAAPIPDWLQAESGQRGARPLEPAELGKAEATPTRAGEPPKAKEAELPEWLAPVSSQPAQPAPGGAETSASRAEVPDWLKRIATDASSVPEEEAPAEPEIGTGELPSWLDSRQPGASDTISKWLGERLGPRPSTEEKPAPRPEPEELPEWLRPAAETGGEGNPEEMESSEPALPPSPPSPGSQPSVEKAGEQAAPDWLRTALNLAETELSSVLPSETVAASQPMEPAPVEPKVPGEKPGGPLPRPEVPAAAAVPGAESARAPEAAPVAGRKPTPKPPTSPFVAPLGEEAPSASERPQWVPVVEPAVAPSVEPARPAGRLPSRTAAAKGAAASKPKPRRLTKEDATQLLAQAHQCLEGGREQEAASAYQKLLESGRCVEEVAEDLEKAVEEFPDSSALWQLLGDANSRLGRLQRAYEAYGKALEKI